jgi:cytochrome c-type biogenesis protein
MIESLFTALNQSLVAGFGLAVAAAGVWGIASVLLSPCHLASIPLLIGFITGQESPTPRRVLALSSVFAVGILITIAVIGPPLPGGCWVTSAPSAACSSRRSSSLSVSI